MKQAENNEMDLLLRSLARREGSKPFPRERMTDGSARSAHLDADELISYAEQTLPAATRARYTIHLADCARCRKIVAELAPAVSVRDHPEEQSETTFWQTVRHFFSLPVLRYAVPALGLFAIVVVGLVVFRSQQPRSDMVAQNRADAEGVAVTQSPPTEVPQEKTDETGEGKALTYSTPNLDAQQKAKSNEQGQATGAGAAIPAPGAGAPIAKDVPAEKAAEVAQPTFAPEPAPPAPKPQDQVADARKETAARTEAARPQSAPAKVPETDRDNYARSGERNAEQERSRAKTEQREDKRASAQVSNAAPDRRGLTTLHAEERLRTNTAGKKSDDETAETRAVAGRRFRRQGDLWVDTAYQSGLSLTVISRGSEQYRALVADEPSIRTIAEQLQGEVILIWKGRGYRIR
jgi:hypothetical protein